MDLFYEYPCNINCTNLCSDNNPASDFEIMMMRKKEEQSMKRRRKDIDIINDNDDIIAGLIGDMKHAAEVIIRDT